MVVGFGCGFLDQALEVDCHVPHTVSSRIHFRWTDNHYLWPISTSLETLSIFTSTSEFSCAFSRLAMMGA